MLPRFGRFARRLSTLPPLNPETALRSEWESLQLGSEAAGKNVALGIGSRGIRHLPAMVKTLVTLLHESGAHPFIVPAMGSHGSATAEGQVDNRYLPARRLFVRGKYTICTTGFTLYKNDTNILSHPT